MIKVLIVDDQRTVQAVLQDYLEPEPGIKIIGCAENGQKALELVEIHRPQIVLMDIEMPVIDGLTATRIITEQYVDTTVLILSVHDEDTYLNTALQVGAKGYLLKNTPAKELINAIYSAYKGYFQLGPGLLEKYLYKVSQSQSNTQEIEQMKTVIFQQSQLLDKINNNSDREERQSPRRAAELIPNERFSVLEQKIYSLSNRSEELTKRLIFLQNFCFFLAIAFMILMIVVFLFRI
jgi:DNA-binding NarL/FixJ family response regulator